MDEGPDTSMDFYRAVATVIPTLLITVAIQGRLFELSRKVTFRLRYVYLAVLALGLAMIYLALTGPERSESVRDDERREGENRGSA